MTPRYCPASSYACIEAHGADAAAFLDGQLSRAEAAALPRLAERFDQIDTNHDGEVTFDELRALHQAQRAKWSGDADGDGKVSKAEFLARATQRFDRLDADKDGFVTADEMRAARHARHGHRGMRGADFK